MISIMRSICSRAVETEIEPGPDLTKPADSSFLRTSFGALLVGVAVAFLAFLLSFVVPALAFPFGAWPYTTQQPYYMNCTASAMRVISWDGQSYSYSFWPTNSTYDALGEKEFELERRDCGWLKPDEPSYYNWTKEVVYKKVGDADPQGFWRWDAAAPCFVLFTPMSLFLHDIYDLGRMASNDTGAYGLHMHNVSSYCTINITSNTLCDSNYSVGSSWGIFFGIYLLYSTLAVYLDNVLPDEMGARRAPYYFLLPSYWCLGESPEIKHSPANVIEESQDEDVLAEEALLAQRVGQPMADDSSIEIRGLLKTFRRGGKQHHAVKCPQYAIKKCQLFALLGPNGAGKTTTVNMLTGILPPSGGEALICGESIMHESSMSRIRSFMGLCPQVDISMAQPPWHSVLPLPHDTRGQCHSHHTPY